jgi:hypothetical protein
MKRIIRLTESELIKLVNRVLNESKFFHQDKVDSILDKINKYGKDSLSDDELEVLGNPDDKLSTSSRDVKKVIKILINNGWIDIDDIEVYDGENYFTLHSIAGEQFEYFDGNNFLIFNVKVNDSGDIDLYVGSDSHNPPNQEGSDFDDTEEESYYEDDEEEEFDMEFNEPEKSPLEVVLEYIMNNWEDELEKNYNILLYEDYD